MRVVEAPIVSSSRGQTSTGPASLRHTPPRVALRSWSLACPLGDDIPSAWDAILAGRFISEHATSGRTALDLARWVATPLLDCGIDEGAALVIGTSKGSVVDWLGPGLHFERPVLDPGLGDIAAAVAREWCLGGPRLTLSAACASGIHALVRAAMMIRAGEVRQALVVATEASVHPLFLGSFQRLGVLAKPGAGCRPFDRGRDGFLMSEAAAAVLLEAADAENSQSSPAAEIVLDRFALAGDATHLTGGDPDARTLRHLLARVIDGRPVDLVHAHGTGTPLNDEAELAAIESAVGPIDHAAPPSVYSHKGALGHSLGAAGLVSVVLNCQAHATGVVPPNVQTRDPLPTSRVTLSPAPVRRAVRRSVAVAAGFGGAMAAVSLVGGA